MSADEPGRETQLLQRHEYSPKNICGLQKEIVQKGKIPFSIWFLSNGRSEIFLDKRDSNHCPSRCGSVCHVHVCVCTDVAFPPCKTSPQNLQSGGLNCKQGERCCPPKKTIITCWTKHGSRVTEEHRCLRDQGPADAKGCIPADPTDTPSPSRLKHPYAGTGGLGPKLFIILCCHEEDQLWRFFFSFFHSQKSGLLQGKKYPKPTLCFVLDFC